MAVLVIIFLQNVPTKAEQNYSLILPFSVTIGHDLTSDIVPINQHWFTKIDNKINSSKGNIEVLLFLWKKYTKNGLVIFYFKHYREQ